MKTVGAFLKPFFILVLFVVPAAMAGPNITYHGRILGHNDQPLEGLGIKFRVRVFSPSPKNCLLYEETRNVDMMASQGVFAISIGAGTYVRSGQDPNLPLEKVFSNNSSVMTSLACEGSYVSYTPQALDHRILEVSYDDGSGWDDLPKMVLNHVPFAVNSHDSQNIGGVPAASVLKVSGGGAAPAITPSDFSELLNLLNGSSVQYEKKGRLNGATLPSTLGNGQVLGWDGSNWTGMTPMTSYTETDPSVKAFAQNDLPICAGSNSFLRNDGSGNLTCVTVAGADGGTVTSVTAGTGLKISEGGTAITNAGTLAVNVGTGVGQVLQFDVANELPVLDGSKLTGVNAQGLNTTNAISSGSHSVTGNISAANGNITATGDGFSTGVISAPSMSTKNIGVNNIFVRSPADHETNGINITAPLIDVAAPYTLRLPTALPSSAMVLGSDALGNLQWMNPAAGSVTSVTAVPPLSVSDADPNKPAISIQAASATQGGYLTSSDYGKFDGKMDSSTVFAGDVTGTSNALSVEKLRGRNIAATSPTADQVLQWDGTTNAWTPKGLPAALVTSVAGKTGAVALNVSDLKTAGGLTQLPITCTADQTLTWAAGLDQYVCTNIGIAGSQIAGQIPLASLGTGTPSASNYLSGDGTWKAMSSSQWTTSGNHIYYNQAGGNVGIGTAAATEKLTVDGGISASTIILNASGGSGMEAIIANPNNSAGQYNFTYADINDQNLNRLIGVISDVQNQSNSIIGEIAGFQTEVFADGVVQNAYGLDVKSVGAMAYGMKPVNTYGVYIGDIDGDNKWSFYASDNSAKNYFAGNVGVGTANPTYKLDVAGDINVTGNFKINGVNLAAGGGSVTNVSSGSTDITVTNPTTTPQVTLNAGIAGGVGDANKIAKLSGTGQLASAMIPNAAGDVTGAYNALTVEKIQSIPVEPAAYSNGQVLRYNSGKWINSLINISSDITGTLEISSGGTGATTAAGALNNLLPAQSGNANKLLQTNGTTATWVDAPVTGITALTGDVTTAAGSGSVVATISDSVITSSKILDGTINGADLNFAGVNSATSSIVMKDSTGAFHSFACATTGHVPTWTATGFACQAKGVGSLNDLPDVYTDGESSIFMGAGTPSSGSEGANNTAFGVDAMSAMDWGSENTAFGRSALESSIGGFSNSAFGESSLRENTTGQLNTAIGANAMLWSTTGSENTALGYSSMFSNISGKGNTALGYQALSKNTTGNRNIGIGQGAGYGNQTGVENIFVGNGTGSNASVNNNTIVGNLIGNLMATGADNNILLGYKAGNNLTSGAKNIVIGYNINLPSATMSNSLNIGNLIYGANLDGAGATLSTGNIGIGITNPAYKLDVAGDINVTGNFKINGVNLAAGGGSVTNVSSGSTDITVINPTTTPQLTLNAGIVGGVGDANKIAKLSGTGQLTSAMIPNAGGDVKGAYSALTVEKIRGREVAAAPPTADQVLQWDAPTSAWTPKALPSAPVTSVAGRTGSVTLNVSDLKTSGGASQFPSACTAAQTLTWSAVTDAFTCVNIGIAADQITSGTVATARLGTGTANGTNFLSGDGTWKTASASPAGANTQIQFNKSGIMGASSALVWNEAKNSLGIGASPNPNANIKLQVTSNMSDMIHLLYTNGALNEKIFSISNSGSKLNFRANDDNISSGSDILSLHRKRKLYIAPYSLTNEPDFDLTFGVSYGGTERTIGAERSPVSNPGIPIVISAGGARLGAADANGGNLILKSGISTGTASSNIQFATAAPQSSTSSTDNAPQTRMTISGVGNVGIGTTTPRAAMDINGTLLMKSSVSNASATVDFLTGNLQHTTLSCGAFNLHNMKDGGSYTFAVKGGTSSTCSFSAYSGAGTGALVIHMPIDHGASVASKHTLYTFLVMGNDVYVSWMPGI